MEILLGVLVMGVCFGLLGVGVAFARRKNTLQGSCGGVAKDRPELDPR